MESGVNRSRWGGAAATASLVRPIEFFCRTLIILLRFSPSIEHKGIRTDFLSQAENAGYFLSHSIPGD